MICELTQKDRLYAEYHDKVSGYVRGKIANAADAEDLVSDIFLKIYDKLDTFDESKSSLSTWIYHITQNTVTDYFRKRRVFAEIPENISDSGEIDDRLLSQETLERLADGLEQLDKRSRDLVILHYYSSMKLKDIADKFGISYVYAKVLHKKALEKLKYYLS